MFSEVALSGTAFSAARDGEGRGRNLKEEEGERVQDRRIKEDEEEETALELTPWVLALTENRRESEGLEREELRRGKEGEKVKAALCILGRSEREMKMKTETDGNGTQEESMEC